MADFALWATACKRALWPATSFLSAYMANRRTAVEDVIEADPVAARILDMMTQRTMWTGNASELLRVASIEHVSAGWPKTPRALAGRLRRAQAPLRALGIEVAFGREGRQGMRIIRLKTLRVA
jgi:hypothetical protein